MGPVLALLASLGLTLQPPCVTLSPGDNDVTAAEIYSVARQAGFSPDAAVKMTAIALRESSGNPTLVNPGVRNPVTGVMSNETSYGLWQINMKGDLGQARLAQLGLSSKDQLYDPLTNARAAYLISSGGSQSALSANWYVDWYGSPFRYAENYNYYLPTAQAAAEQVEGGAVQAGAEPGDVPVLFSSLVYGIAPREGESPVGGLFDSPNLGLYALLGFAGLAAVLLVTGKRREQYA
jgi:hypothetical protein